MGQRMNAPDETLMTEITILPDGRLYVFGMSRPVLEILRTLDGDDRRLERLQEQVDSSQPIVTADLKTASSAP
jgi:hypothetical protein